MRTAKWIFLVSLNTLAAVATVAFSPQSETQDNTAERNAEYLDEANRDSERFNVLNTTANDLATTSEAGLDELLQPVRAQSMTLREASAGAAERLLAEIDTESIVRWRGTFVDTEVIVPAQNVTELQKPETKAVAQLKISPFPDVSFVVTKKRFDRHGTSATWVAEITEGGIGYVDAHLAPRDDGTLALFVNIRSDKGNFNMASTDLDCFYVIGEANPHRSVEID